MHWIPRQPVSHLWTIKTEDKANIKHIEKIRISLEKAVVYAAC